MQKIQIKVHSLSPLHLKIATLQSFSDFLLTSFCFFMCFFSPKVIEQFILTMLMHLSFKKKTKKRTVTMLCIHNVCL